MTLPWGIEDERTWAELAAARERERAELTRWFDAHGYDSAGEIYLA